ncbi:MAG: DUF58 domain-containing protein [Halobacteriota archaeon]
MRATNRWRGVVAVTLAAGAVGLLADRPDLLLVSVVGVVFAAYPRLSPPASPTVEIDRTLSDRTSRPGEAIEVTVTVRNCGPRLLADVRVVDGVPPALSVTDGTPRHGTALLPGGETTFSYAVESREGTHGFDPATVVLRDLSGAREVETTVEADADTEIDCTAEGVSAPRRSLAIEDVGDLLTDRGGAGVEFFSTREYRRGDAPSRVDWNRYAKTGDLTTVEFREEHAAAIVLLIDARESAYRAVGDRAHAVVWSVGAAQRLLVSLLGRRNRVGLSALGGERCWAPPDAGLTHQTTLSRLLQHHPAFAATPPEGDACPSLDSQVAELRSNLSPGSQVALLSPLCDDDIVAVARRLDAHGYPVTVVSPDVTAETTPGQRLATVERTNRIGTLRRADIPVVDWEVDERLDAALLKAERGVSA